MHLRHRHCRLGTAVKRPTIDVCQLLPKNKANTTASRSRRPNNCLGLWVVGCNDCHSLLLVPAPQSQSTLNYRSCRQYYHLRSLCLRRLVHLSPTQLDIIRRRSERVELKNLESSAVSRGLDERQGHDDNLSKS